MTDQDLPLEPEPTPEERAHFEQLSAALDGWAADTSVRLPDPTSAPATTSPPAGAPVTTGDGPDVLGWIRRPHFAAAILAASVVAFLLLPDPGIAPSDPTPNGTPGAARTLEAHDLEVASPHPYMIVPTRDPSISIVWLLDTEQGD